MSSLTMENGNLVLQTPYNKELVMVIKTLPTSDRMYDPKRKIWYIHPKQGKLIKQWVNTYLGEDVAIPTVNHVDPVPVTSIFEVRYIGTTKIREDGAATAFGLVDRDWKLIFPETVLRSWFDAGPSIPGASESLYAVLGASQQATEEEIKSAYRRMVRQWHPDVCREANAQEMFIRIQHAYETLSNPIQRAKYNAGLKLQASMSQPVQNSFSAVSSGYRSPLRCGLLLVDGIEKLGRFVVTKIHGWEDIMNSTGQILVTSWALGAKEPTEIWS